MRFVQHRALSCLSLLTARRGSCDGHLTVLRTSCICGHSCKPGLIALRL